MNFTKSISQKKNLHMMFYIHYNIVLLVDYNVLTFENNSSHPSLA